MENLTPEIRARAEKIISFPGQHGSDIENTTDVHLSSRLTYYSFTTQ